MSPRTGRPTDDPKDLSVRIRLSQTDQTKLAFCQEQTGKTKAEIIRIGIDKVYQELTQKKD